MVLDLITVKIIALSLLGGVSLLLGFLPLKLGSLIDTSDFGGERNFWKRTITSVLLCFGGGVLLATSFVHMLPEVMFVWLRTLSYYIPYQSFGCQMSDQHKYALLTVF
jgi:hypothetical protein